MARPQAEDFLHSMRFKVAVVQNGADVPSLQPGDVEAGFSAVGTPSVSAEVAEYREGQYIYTRKFPGIPSMDDITLSRGVARRDSTFWNWMLAALEGGLEYRVDLEIQHFHRDQVLNQNLGTTRPNTDTSQAMAEWTSGNTVPARSYRIEEAFPINHKVASDLDGTASEVSIQEITVSYERFKIIEAA